MKVSSPPSPDFLNTENVSPWRASVAFEKSPRVTPAPLPTLCADARIVIPGLELVVRARIPVSGIKRRCVLTRLDPDTLVWDANFAVY